MANNQQTRAIKKTIIIGLGGTGRDVLMRIRRFIIDKYGKLSNLPIVSFVHIDTDKNAFNSSGLPTGNSYHGEDILLSAAERVFINMNAQDVNNLTYELEHKTLFESPFSHIESWLDPRLKKQITAIENGAGGIRPVGRLAFFHNYQKIKEAIEAAERRTAGHESFMFSGKVNGQSFNVQEGLNVFIVGSLCGGTGSGIFLDMAYTLRHILQQTTEYTSFGYLVISPKLYGDGAIMKANTYAALKELDHYTNESNSFQACYDKQNFVNIDEKRSPFDFAYLVSNRTAGDYQINNKGKLCNVIAYKIFLDFADELSPHIKSNRDNYKDPMIRKDNHPFQMCQGYMSFGLARIYFTRDRIVQISLNHFTLKLIKFWLEGYGQSPSGQELLSKFLANWTTQSNKDYFSARLEEATLENNKTFSKTLISWKNSLEEEISNSQDLENLPQTVKQSLEKEFRKVQGGETDSSRGIWLTLTQQTQPKLTEKFKSDIDQFLEILLNPDSLEFSLENSLSFLVALQAQINTYKGNLEELSQDNKGFHSSEKIDNIWRDVKQTLEDINGKKSVFKMFNKNANSEKIKAELRDYAQKVQKLIQQNFNFSINGESRKIVEAILKHISSRILQIQQLKEILQQLITDYDKYEQELMQLNLDEMTGEGIFPEENIDNCIPDSNSRSQYVSVSQKVTNNLGYNASLFSLFSQSFAIDNETLKDTLTATIEKQFQSVSANKIDAVIKRFMGKYKPHDFPERLGQILREADLMLPINVNDAYYRLHKNKELLIGTKDDDSPTIQRFKNILESDLNINLGTSFESIQTDEEILITYEFGGFPLRIITDLFGLQNNYQKQNKNSILHNNYKIDFADIIPPQAKLIEELEFLFYPAIALGLLEYDEEDSTYQLVIEGDLFNNKSIINISGNWRVSLEQLASRNDMITALQALLNQAKNEILADPSRLFSDMGDYFKKFIYFSNNVKNLPSYHPNYPCKDKVIGQDGNIQQEAKEGIITRFVNQLKMEIEKRAAEQKELEKQQQKQQALSGTNNNGHQPSLLAEVSTPDE
jgi:Tubulin like